MLTGKQFVEKIVQDNQALFQASQHNVRAYFESQPAQEELVEHFIGRMVNERMNMVEISRAIAELPADTDPVELELLTKQAQDEARHFRMVKEVIEHITGAPVDVEQAIARETAQPTAKGASLLEKYNAQDDEAALAAYQLVAEGRAEAVWDEMARCVEDQFIAGHYAKIARDEGFHAKIGARRLAQLAEDVAVQDRIATLVAAMRRDLYEISCRNTTAAAAGRDLVADAYGW
jgi:hypothetical protein